MKEIGEPTVDKASHKSTSVRIKDQKKYKKKIQNTKPQKNYKT